MKKRIFSRVLALFMALSLLSTTALAASFAELNNAINNSGGTADNPQIYGSAKDIAAWDVTAESGTVRNVQLTGDVTNNTSSPAGININKAVVLDLNGHTIDSKPTNSDYSRKYATISVQGNQADLTVTNSDENKAGRIAGGEYGIYVGNLQGVKGSLNVDANVSISGYEKGVAVFGKNANAVISGENTVIESSSSLGDGLYLYGSTATLKNGATVKGGNGVKIERNGSITIESANLESTSQSTVSGWGLTFGSGAYDGGIATIKNDDRTVTLTAGNGTGKVTFEDNSTKEVTTVEDRAVLTELKADGSMEVKLSSACVTYPDGSQFGYETAILDETGKPIQGELLHSVTTVDEDGVTKIVSFDGKEERTIAVELPEGQKPFVRGGIEIVIPDGSKIDGRVYPAGAMIGYNGLVVGFGINEDGTISYSEYLSYSESTHEYTIRPPEGSSTNPEIEKIQDGNSFAITIPKGSLVTEGDATTVYPDDDVKVEIWRTGTTQTSSFSRIIALQKELQKQDGISETGITANVMLYIVGLSEKSEVSSYYLIDSKGHDNEVTVGANGTTIVPAGSTIVSLSLETGEPGEAVLYEYGATIDKYGVITPIDPNSPDDPDPNPNPDTPDNPDPNTPDTPDTPATPDAGFDFGGDTGTIIEDEEIPLAGLVSIAQLLEELRQYEGIQDVELPDGFQWLDHEFAQAIHWGLDEALVADSEEKPLDPDEIVTVALLREILGNYVKLCKGLDDFVVSIEHEDEEDDMIVMDLGERLIVFYDELEAALKA